MMRDPSFVPQDNRVLFFSRDRAKFRFLSHFHVSRITIDGVDWSTVKHFYQPQKSLDPRYYKAIRACHSPDPDKRLSRHPQVGSPRNESWFVGRCPGLIGRKSSSISCVAPMPPSILRTALARRLLATSVAEIIEDTKYGSGEAAME